MTAVRIRAKAPAPAPQPYKAPKADGRHNRGGNIHSTRAGQPPVRAASDRLYSLEDLVLLERRVRHLHAMWSGCDQILQAMVGQPSSPENVARAYRVRARRADAFRKWKYLARSYDLISQRLKLSGERIGCGRGMARMDGGWEQQQPGKHSNGNATRIDRDKAPALEGVSWRAERF